MATRGTTKSFKNRDKLHCVQQFICVLLVLNIGFFDAGCQEEIPGVFACKQKDIGHQRYGKLACGLFPPFSFFFFV